MKRFGFYLLLPGILFVTIESCQRNFSKCDAYSALGKGGRMNYAASRPQATAGTITAGEVNDLSKWDMWKDLSKDELASQRQLWEMQFTERYTFIIQNKDQQPVIGAKVALYNDYLKKPIWSGRSDNLGRVQLWNSTKTDISKSSEKASYHVEITYKDASVRVNNPKTFEEGINIQTLDVACDVPDNVDIAFVVDATGSMGDEIDFLKKDLLDIINTSLKSNNEIQLNLGSLFYRCEDNSYVTKKSDFSSNLNKTIDFIKAQSADEGGDEVVAKALNETIHNMSWRDDARAKLLFIVLDEPPGSNPTVNKAMLKAMKDASDKGIKIIPCVASGVSNSIDRNLEYLMRCSAVATNGTYVFFTDDSGVGNAHTIPLVGSYEVEKLNALLKRIISTNTEVAPCTDPEVTTSSDTLSLSTIQPAFREVMDSLMNNVEDSALAQQLLPYTSYTTIEELNENRPVQALDTIHVLEDFKSPIDEMKVYPNPSRGQFIVETTNSPDYIYLLDAAGRLLYRYDMEDKKRLDLNLHELPKGNYYVKTTLNGHVLSCKITKV